MTGGLISFGLFARIWLIIHDLNSIFLTPNQPTVLSVITYKNRLWETRKPNDPVPALHQSYRSEAADATRRGATAPLSPALHLRLFLFVMETLANGTK